MDNTVRQPIRDVTLEIPKDGRYKEEFAVMLLNHRSEGRSFASFGAVVGVGVVTLRKWVEEHEGFRDAFDISDSYAIGFWEDIALDQAIGRVKGSSTTLLSMLKNQFPDFYKDKTEVDHNVGVIFKIDTGIPCIEVVGESVTKDHDLL